MRCRWVAAFLVVSLMIPVAPTPARSCTIPPHPDLVTTGDSHYYGNGWACLSRAA